MSVGSQDRLYFVSQAETTKADLRPEQQAKQTIMVRPYVPYSFQHQNQLYISTGTNRVSVEDRLSLKLSISTANPEHRAHIKHITYLVRQECCIVLPGERSVEGCADGGVFFVLTPSQVLNKGRIIAAERLDVTGQQVTSVGLTVTPEMMPSFRFVAFYSIPWTEREEVVPDSIWVDVADSCAGGVRSLSEVTGGGGDRSSETQRLAPD